MVEILGKYYYIDIDAISDVCKIQSIVKDGEDVMEVNIFKYEIIKMCLERLLNDLDDDDDALDNLMLNSKSVSFKMALNTLLKYKIIIEYENEQY